MKKVLCFGDSNTYGFIPSSGGRYGKNVRWTGVLQKILGAEYKIIEEGCNNRTCFAQNPDGKAFTGIKILPELLAADLDFVILSVGINDLQFQYDRDLADFSAGIGALIELVKSKSPSAKIILTAPSVIRKNILKSFFAAMFDSESIEKSQKLPEIYEKCAKEKGCIFLDLNKIVKTSDVDGLHYEAEEHGKIAKALAQLLLNP